MRFSQTASASSPSKPFQQRATVNQAVMSVNRPHKLAERTTQIVLVCTGLAAGPDEHGVGTSAAAAAEVGTEGADCLYLTALHSQFWQRGRMNSHLHVCHSTSCLSSISVGSCHTFYAAYPHQGIVLL
jgi:hypothetical protein